MNEKKESIIEYIKSIYPNKFENIVNNLDQKPTTFRINRIKNTPDKVLDSLSNQGFIIENGPFENSYIVITSTEKIRLSETPEFSDGQIYIQELSSMIPPILLDPKPNEYVLDIAAAPGSKTTQIAELSGNQAKILAIEKVYDRYKRLISIVNQQSADFVNIVHGNGIKFDLRNPQYSNFFDKALVDAPCSSEGRFNFSNSESYKYWNFKKRNEMSKMQKGLLISAYRMLKPGGTLVYSTCTFGFEENELILNWFLEKYPDSEIEKVDLPIKNTVNGFTEYNGKALNPQIKNAIRIIPDENFGGFFIAKIKKQ